MFLINIFFQTESSNHKRGSSGFFNLNFATYSYLVNPINDILNENDQLQIYFKVSFYLTYFLNY